MVRKKKMKFVAALAEDERERRKKRRAQRNRFETCVIRPIYHSVRGAPSVSLGGVVASRTAEFPKTRTQHQKS